MLIQVDPSSDLPLYEQLIRQMTFLVAQRAYREHELVPSVREVSKSLAVNPNTVVRAYRHLQQQGILVARRGMGMAVAESGCPRAAQEREAIVSERLADTLVELRQSGLPDAEIRDTFLKLLEDGSPQDRGCSQSRRPPAEQGEPVMNDAIQLDRLSKRFKTTEALKNVTLDVPEGSVFALLGENGAGKTTAIRIMLGLERPDSGHARVLGYDCKSEDLDIRRRVGYVPETPDLYNWMTVQQIGWYAAGFYPQGYWERFTAMAQEFQLVPKAKIKNLSKGMRAKVSLTLALSHDPDLLILDEPTSGLDAMIRREFLESMVQRAADGRTVFLSSHQINEGGACGRVCGPDSARRSVAG